MMIQRTGMGSSKWSTVGSEGGGDCPELISGPGFGWPGGRKH